MEELTEKEKKAIREMEEGYATWQAMGPTPEKLALKRELERLSARYESGEFREPAEAPKPPSEPRGSAVNPLAEGATFGASGELAGLGGAAVAAATGNLAEGDTFGDAYTHIRDEVEGDLASYREENPTTSFLLEAGGNAATGGALANRATQALWPGQSPAARVARNAVGSAAGGAAYHGMSAKPDERAEAAMQGALIEGPLGAAVGEGVTWLGRRSRAKQARQDSFANYAGDKEQVAWRQNSQGKIVPDGLAREARRQGIDDDTIVAIKSVTPADRRRMEQMLDVERQRQRFPTNSVNLRASDVVGDAIGKRYETVLKLNREAGEKLDDIAQNELRDVDVRVIEPLQEFLADVHKMGATVSWMDGPAEVDFADSILDSKLLAEDQTLIREVMGRVDRLVGSQGDAYDVHLAKQFIDEHINWGGKDGGASAKVQAALRKLRRGLNEVLRNASDDYRKVNDQYSDTLAPLEKLQSLADQRIDLTGPDAASHLGMLSRRLTSNYASRVPLRAAIGELEAVAGKYGTTFSDNIAAQVLFVNELELLFGPAGATSLGADVAKGVARGQGWKETVGQAAGQRLGPFFGRSQDAKIDALQALLRQEY